MPRAAKEKKGSTRKGGPVRFIRNGLHAASRDSSYSGTVHWDGNTAGEAWLIKPPGPNGTRTKLEYCHALPVSGEFDIETSGGACVTRDP